VDAIDDSAHAEIGERAMAASARQRMRTTERTGDSGTGSLRWRFFPRRVKDRAARCAARRDRAALALPARVTILSATGAKPPPGASPMPFVAYDLSLDLIRNLRAPLAIVRARNADLARQLDRAADSVHQNLAEAGGRHGDDRTRLFRYSYGSLREVRASLELGVAKGWLDGREPAHALAHRLGGLLFRLARL
jgi:four helix bundle protein